MKLRNLLITSLVTTTLLSLINIIYALFTKHLLIYLSVHGGEIIQDFGFGVRIDHIYSMGLEGGVTHRLYFDLSSFLITFLFISIVLLLIKLAISKLKNK